MPMKEKLDVYAPTGEGEAAGGAGRGREQPHSAPKARERAQGTEARRGPEV